MKTLSLNLVNTVIMCTGPIYEWVTYSVLSLLFIVCLSVCTFSSLKGMRWWWIMNRCECQLIHNFEHLARQPCLWFSKILLRVFIRRHGQQFTSLRYIISRFNSRTSIFHKNRVKVNKPESSSSIFNALEMCSNAFLWWCFWRARAGSPGPTPCRPLSFNAIGLAKQGASSSDTFFPADRCVKARLLRQPSKTSATHSWYASVRKTAKMKSKGAAYTRRFRPWIDR